MKSSFGGMICGKLSIKRPFKNMECERPIKMFSIEFYNTALVEALFQMLLPKCIIQIYSVIKTIFP